MKFICGKYLRLSLLLILLLVTLAPVEAGGVVYNEALFERLAQSHNPIPEIRLPKYDQFKLANGLKVYLMEDHRFPVVLLGGFVKGGKSLETIDTAGSADLMSSMITSGSQEFGSDYRARHALSFNFRAGRDNYSFSGNALANKLEELLQLTSESLRRPDFNRDFSRKRREREQRLQQAGINADSLAQMVMFGELFSPEHPYALGYDYQRQIRNLQQLTSKDLTAYYLSSIAPDNTVLWLCGDFDRKAAKALVRQYFTGWQRREVGLNQTKAVAPEGKPGRIVVVDKPDAAQATILMGTYFYDQQYYNDHFQELVAFELANEIYGGGDFESRLLQELRTEKGYVYSLYAGFAAFPLGGVYLINTRVQQEKALETIDAIKEIMADLKKGSREFTSEELYKAVNQRNLAFPDQYRYPESVLESVVVAKELKGRKPGFINDYIKAYNQVELQQVQAAFSKYATPDALLTVIVGQQEQILPQLEGMEVEVYSIPD